LASYLLGDSVNSFPFIIGVYLFSMGVGSYLAKFIKGNLIDKFVEIEILVGAL
jgi:spermidine synthase